MHAVFYTISYILCKRVYAGHACMHGHRCNFHACLLHLHTNIYLIGRINDEFHFPTVNYIQLIINVVWYPGISQYCAQLIINCWWSTCHERTTVKPYVTLIIIRIICFFPPKIFFVFFGVCCYWKYFRFHQNNFFSFKKWFPFLNFVNNFPSLSFSVSNFRTTIKLAPGHHQANPGQCRTTTEPP